MVFPVFWLKIKRIRLYDDKMATESFGSLFVEGVFVRLARLPGKLRTHAHVNQTKSNWTIYYIKITVLPEKCSLFIQRMYAKNVAHCGIYAMFLFHISFFSYLFCLIFFLFFESKKTLLFYEFTKNESLCVIQTHTTIQIAINNFKCEKCTEMWWKSVTRKQQFYQTSSTNM